MSVLLLCLSASAQDRYAPIGEPVDAAGLSVDAGPLTMTMSTGSVQPFGMAGADEPLGVVVTGAGDFAYRFMDRADAWAFANRSVMWFDQPREALAPVAHLEAPWTSTLEQAIIFLPAEKLSAILAEQPAAEAEGRAMPTLSRRLDALGACLPIPGAGSLSGGEVVVALQSTERLGLISPNTRTDEDRWMLVSHRPDSSPETRAYAVGRDIDGDRKCGQLDTPPWEEPDAPTEDGPRFYSGISPVAVDIEMSVVPETGLRMPVTLTATYRVRGSQRADDRIPLGWVSSSVEHSDVQITLDGAPATVEGTLGSGAEVILPAPLQPDQEAVIGITASVPLTLEAAVGGGEGVDLHTALPWVAARWARWSGSLTVAFPEGSDYTTAQTGLTVGSGDADGRKWIRSEFTDHTLPRLRTRAGIWKTHHEPAVGNMPAVRVNLFPSEASNLPQFPPFVRAILNFYEGFLPSVGLDELEIYQAPDAFGHFVWTATLGITSVQQMQAHSAGSVRADEPHLEEYVLAHEIAHQYWGGRVVPARVEDRWMSETFADVYACQFIAAAFSPEACTTRLDSWRQTWERPTASNRTASLRRARHSHPWWQERAYEYGPLIFGSTLHAYIGTNALFGGLDSFVQGHMAVSGSADALQAALEESSGISLDDFFDFWVYGGFIPAVTAVIDGTQVRLTSDVPFGNVAVPIQARYADRSRSEVVWVDIRDGAGEITLEKEPRKVVVDPEGWLPLRKRKGR